MLDYKIEACMADSYDAKTFFFCLIRILKTKFNNYDHDM